MPHLTIQHSPALGQRHDMTVLCDQLRQVLIAQRCFDPGGVRVRAWTVPAEALADGHRDNVCADMVLRMGTGRSVETRQEVGEALMAAAETFFASELREPHMIVSLEIVEIDEDLSWKTNSIHQRLKGAAA
ncbi:5-carboxymethyl-2-hydroxymuconate isomerase [Aliishimia ponticola]|uniref:5-carboxymethyl-2-hydroxymuconate isomerase n=1 Tax=Aliishimia ponticola TaxID=2499833 RepID=A0A4S4NF26_9RHOB|nr:5-carboxymethyl-2-hydroxymuconate isomerase [Aliishimia ponticola]THH37177.1 5-carboxymethyl-2-hydroxymuconate isomerase [Aliishimia ponticola]